MAGLVRLALGSAAPCSDVLVLRGGVTGAREPIAQHHLQLQLTDATHSLREALRLARQSGLRALALQQRRGKEQAKKHQAPAIRSHALRRLSQNGYGL